MGGGEGVEAVEGFGLVDEVLARVSLVVDLGDVEVVEDFWLKKKEMLALCT